VHTYEAGNTPTSKPEEAAKARSDSGISDEESLSVAKSQMKGFLESAVQMNRQSIIAAERTIGFDHFTTAQQYIDLGILEHANGNPMLGLRFLRHAVDLLTLIYGEGHPESTRALSNAAQMLSQWKDYAGAVPLLNSAVKYCSNVKGSTSLATGNILSQLANAQALNGDLIISKETARLASEIFNVQLGKFDEKTVEADNLYEILTKAVLNRERGEHAKLGRLARRLGLNEERAKQLLARTAGKDRQQDKLENGKALTTPQIANTMSHLSVDQLVDFIEGGRRSGKKRTLP